MAEPTVNAEINLEQLKEIIAEYSQQKWPLIPLLQRIQNEFGYIPPQSIPILASALRLFPSQVQGVISFYEQLYTEPRGKNIVRVCRGTACHVRGGPMVLEECERKLEIKAGETTPDGDFTLETVNCIGCCAIGPVVLVDEDYHGHAAVPTVQAILKKYQDPSARRA